MFAKKSYRIMERKGLPGTEAYPFGLLSVPGNDLQPMRLRGVNAKISRIQVLFKFHPDPVESPSGLRNRNGKILFAVFVSHDGFANRLP